MHEKGVLYLCATPIGNLKDISLRCLETLQSVDLIAAEDTRQTIKLLNHYQIHTPMTSYYEHNKQEKGGYLLELLLAGKRIALVSDAGTPAISDPGEDLVRKCTEHGITVTAVPGAVAGICALISSGMATGRFCFEGFLSVNKRQRRQHLDDIRHEKRTMLFYEAPHKLRATLHDLYETLGDRQICVARELTKRYEEITKMMLSEAIQKYEAVTPRGEFVLVIEGDSADKNSKIDDSLSIAEHVKRYMDAGMSEMDAMKAAAKDRGIRKNEIYAELKKK